jgi:hypothetical protein
MLILQRFKPECGPPCSLLAGLGSSFLARLAIRFSSLTLLQVLAVTVLNGITTFEFSENFDSEDQAIADGWQGFNTGEDGMNFGFSSTANAGRGVGEAGGAFSRSTNSHYYADTTLGGYLTRLDRISASGRLALTGGEGFNSRICLGHFESRARFGFELDFIGIVLLENTPTTLRAKGFIKFGTWPGREGKTFILSKSSVYQWKYQWVPDGGETGNGQLSLSFRTEMGEDQSDSVPLEASDEGQSFSVNAFGLSSGLVTTASSNTFSVFIDDVTYTALPLPSRLQSPLRVFVLAGQSNARGKDSDLRPLGTLSQAQNDVLFFDESEGWIYMKPPNELSGRFGSEVQLGRDLADAFNGPVGVIKLAPGGTALDPDWNPQISGSYYHVLTNKCASAIHELETKFGVRTQLASIFWMQGETEAGTEESASNYKVNLVAFAQKLREDFANPQLPFIYGRISALIPPDVLPFNDILRAGQEAAREEIRPSFMVDTDDLPLLPDNLHFSTPAQMELGRRFANAYMSLSGSIEPALEATSAGSILVRFPTMAGRRYDIFSSEDLMNSNWVLLSTNSVVTMGGVYRWTDPLGETLQSRSSIRSRFYRVRLSF